MAKVPDNRRESLPYCNSDLNYPMQAVYANRFGQNNNVIQ